MIRFEKDSLYYEIQNGRSGMPLDANKLPKYIDKFNLHRGDKALDVGCRGHANTVSYLIKQGFDAYGFDIGHTAGEMWKRGDISHKLCIHDAHDVFPYEFKFDLISMSHVLEHCHTPEVVLANVKNALGDGGKVFCTVPIESGDTFHKPHYCVFNSHQEHIDMFTGNGFSVTEGWEAGGNSYVIATHDYEVVI